MHWPRIWTYFRPEVNIEMKLSLSATKNIRAALNAVIDRIKLHLNKDKIR